MATSVDHTVDAKTIVHGFNGWHNTADDGSGKTVAAIATNDLKHQIMEKMTNKVQCTTKYYQLLYLNDGMQSHLDQRYAMFRPCVLWMHGPALNSVPTLMQVGDWIEPTPHYSIVKIKAQLTLTSTIGRYRTPHPDSLTMAYDYIKTRTQVRGGEADVFDISVMVEAFAGNEHVLGQLATLIKAASVQHICDTDGGTKFRDKLGRQAAADELATAAETVLFRFCISGTV